MASNGLVFRAGRGPSCVLVGLVCVIIILCYSYWGLSSNNQRLIKDVGILEDHLRVLAARKLTSDKKNTMLTKELTQVQKEKEKVEESIRERNVDISDAKNQLKEKGDELSKLHDQEVTYVPFNVSRYPAAGKCFQKTTIDTRQSEILTKSSV